MERSMVRRGKGGADGRGEESSFASVSLVPSIDLSTSSYPHLTER